MIDPRKPDFLNTPVAPARPKFNYAPRVIKGGEGEQIVTVRARGGTSGATSAGGEPVATLTRAADATQAPARAISLPKPLVTITTAFYNTGEVFRETARCVFGQSLQAWEWVIVNDGSTDPVALAILDEFRRIDPRVRVVDHPQNRGLSAARNTGFREARTPYVYQVDSDDLIEPTAVEKCLWYMHTHPEAAFVSSRIVGFSSQEYLWDKGFHDGAAFLRENLATPMGIVRRAVFDEVGGYNEKNRGGMEDWDFWLRCAAHGHWGETIPEYLGWYRRREQHWDSWANMRAEEHRRAFHEEMMEKYEPALTERFPSVPRRPRLPFEDIRIEPGLSNPLAKGSPRLLLVAPWLTLGGADKFNVAMIRELVERGWEITVATTLEGDNSWLPEFSGLTPDVFVGPHFLHETDVPCFLRYLIESRAPDVVMVSNSELGYHVLPYLRAYCPEPAYVDLSHMEEPWWKNGGHPRYSAGSQAMLDLNIAVSEHLKDWQVARGADRDRIEVCYVSACEDSQRWRRDDEARRRVREGLEIADGQPVILYAGRIVEQKRPQVFAAVVKELVALDLDFTCIVAGDGPDMGWLRRYVGDNALGERVRLLGAVPHGQMHELMSASDIFFLPSMWEGIAISIYEAMSMELAVVGADVGGQRELVTPECGVLVPRLEDQHAELEEYVAAMAAILADPARRAEMGRRGRERIRTKFEPSHMGDRIDELLRLAQRRRDEEPRAPVAASFGVECAQRGVEYLRAWELCEIHFQARQNLARERDELRREREDLERRRDHLLSERDGLRLDLYAAGRGNGCHHLPDPSEMAQRMISENMRYVAVDRINSALKSLHVQSTLKALTVRVLGRRPGQPKP